MGILNSNVGKCHNSRNHSNIEWRKSKVLELMSHGYNQSEISRILQIPDSTINRDVSYLRQQAKDNIRRYVDERLPEEYEKCLVGITSILREAWTTSHRSQDSKEKIQALSLAKECYSMKLDLLTNATVVSDAMRFVSEHNNKKEVKEKDISSVAAVAEEETTTNQVF